MPLDATTLGPLLCEARRRSRLSQPEAAQRAGVSTRLWSEVERGVRPHVSAATLLRMLAEVGVTLEPLARADAASVSPAASASDPGGGIGTAAPDVEALRDDLRRAAAFGVDLSMIRASLRKTALQRVQENDDALAFFGSISVEPGWHPTRTNGRPAPDVRAGTADARRGAPRRVR